MKKIARFVFVALLALCSHALVAADSVHVQVGDIDDRRTTGKFFAGLELELKLIGDILGDAKAVRTLVKSATDDTGRSLLDEEDKKDASFEDLRSSRNGSGGSVKLKLKNPARKAVAVKEVRGELQFFVPKNDPAANISVASIKEQSGKPIESPALKAAGIQVLLFDKAGYDARKAKQSKEAEKSADENNLAGALKGAFKGLFSGFMNVGENSLVLLVQDADAKLVGVEFQDAEGRKVRNNSSMTSGEKSEQTKIYDFNGKLPEKLVLQILTPKSLVAVPLELKDVPLP